MFCLIFIFVNSTHTMLSPPSLENADPEAEPFQPNSHGADFSLALELVKGSSSTCGQIMSLLPISLPKIHSSTECKCWESPQQSSQCFHFIDGETETKNNKRFAQYPESKRWKQGQNPCLLNSQPSVFTTQFHLFLESDGTVRALAQRVEER